MRLDLWEEGIYLFFVLGFFGNVSECCGLLVVFVNIMFCFVGCVCGKYIIWIREIVSFGERLNIVGRL